MKSQGSGIGSWPFRSLIDPRCLLSWMGETVDNGCFATTSVTTPKTISRPWLRRELIGSLGRLKVRSSVLRDLVVLCRWCPIPSRSVLSFPATSCPALYSPVYVTPMLGVSVSTLCRLLSACFLISFLFFHFSLQPSPTVFSSLTLFNVYNRFQD